MKITITPDAAFKKLAKVLDGKPARRASIKGVNEAGKALRGDVPGIVTSQVVSTSKAALGMKARAASEKRSGRNAMAYEIRFRGAVPVSKLRASARKFKKKGSGDTGKLTLKFPGGGDGIEFQSAKKAGKGFTLNRAGDLPERGVGDVGFRTRFRNSRQLKHRLAQAGKEAMAAVEKELLKALGAKR